jgi:hypothetical protein
MICFQTGALAASLVLSAVATAQTVSPQPPAGTASVAPAPPGSPSRAPADTRDEVIDKMTKSVRTSPYLHVRARVVSDRIGTAYIEAWMSKEADRNEVYKDGRLVHAMYVNGQVTQEYAPRLAFKNGTRAEELLIEYTRQSGPESWPKLIDNKLACDAVGVAGDTWIRTAAPDQLEDVAIPEMWADNARTSEMTDAMLGTRPCHYFRAARHMDATHAMIWELYVDKATCEPVRQEKTAINAGKILHETTDYWIEHLDSDAGIEWKLARGTLKDKRLSPEVAALFPQQPEPTAGKEGGKPAATGEPEPSTTSGR